MTPEGETAHGKGQASPQCFRHGGIVGEAVAAPVYRELLASYSSTSGKQNRFAFPLHFAQKVETRPVVQKRIVVMHGMRVTSVRINHIHRNSLAEIGFETVHTAVKESSQVSFPEQYRD